MNSNKTLSEIMDAPIYYRHQHITPAGEDQELVVFVGIETANFSIERGRHEASASLTPDAMRALAGALLDASDAIDNARRTGYIKPMPAYR